MAKTLSDLNLDQPVHAYLRRDPAVLQADQDVAQAIASLQGATLGPVLRIYSTYALSAQTHDAFVRSVVSSVMVTQSSNR